MKTNQASQGKKSFLVKVSRHNGSHALAETRGHQLSLNIKKGDGSAGFNAAETLLSALGACILTNVNHIGAIMQLDIRSAHIEFEAERQDDPAMLTSIRYNLVLESAESQKRLEELHNLSLKWGTVTNTLTNGLIPKGELEIRPSLGINI